MTEKPESPTSLHVSTPMTSHTSTPTIPSIIAPPTLHLPQISTSPLPSLVPPHLSPAAQTPSSTAPTIRPHLAVPGPAIRAISARLAAWRSKRQKLLLCARLGVTAVMAPELDRRPRSLMSEVTAVRATVEQSSSVGPRQAQYRWSLQEGRVSMVDMMIGGRGEIYPISGRRGGYALGLRASWA
jgi:hypothetical protein